MPTILVTDYGFPDLEREKKVAAVAGAALVSAQGRTPEEVIAAARAAGADVLLVQWARIDATVFAALPGLRGVVRYGIGVDNVDLTAARAAGVPVCNVPDYCIDEVADHALALALALARQLPQTHARLAAGEWKITPPGPIVPPAETTFATAGFGRIARAVLQRAAALGYRCAAHDPFVPAAAMRAAGVRPLTRDDLWTDAGILSLHLPLTAETKHLVNAESLARMRPEAILVNTSRGALVDTRALAEALCAGRLAGAGIDVFETEPLEPDHPLRTAPNTLLTSHTAWFSRASVPRLQQLAAEEAVRLLQGEAPRNRVA